MGKSVMHGTSTASQFIWFEKRIEELEEQLAEAEDKCKACPFDNSGEQKQVSPLGENDGRS